jgi:hypothetical protein
MSNADARQQALALRDAFEFESTSLVSYQSTGKVVALGDDDALAKCSELPAALDISPVSTSISARFRPPAAGFKSTVISVLMSSALPTGMTTRLITRAMRSWI